MTLGPLPPPIADAAPNGFVTVCFAPLCRSNDADGGDGDDDVHACAFDDLPVFEFSLRFLASVAADTYTRNTIQMKLSTELIQCCKTVRLLFQFSKRKKDLKYTYVRVLPHVQRSVVGFECPKRDKRKKKAIEQREQEKVYDHLEIEHAFFLEVSFPTKMQFR